MIFLKHGLHGIHMMKFCCVLLLLGFPVTSLKTFTSVPQKEEIEIVDELTIPYGQIVGAKYVLTRSEIEAVGNFWMSQDNNAFFVLDLKRDVRGKCRPIPDPHVLTPQT